MDRERLTGSDGVVATARAFQGDVQRHLYAH